MRIARKLMLPAAALATAAPVALAATTATASPGPAVKPVSVTASRGTLASDPAIARGIAIPDAASHCTYGSSSGNVDTCFAIGGSGLYVTSMVISATVVHAGRTLHSEIAGPSLTYVTPNQYVAPGGYYDYSYNLFKDVGGGYYYGTTFRKNSNGTYTIIGQVAINVHS